MNKTTNYQLNQWQATDHVKRTDFNEDNAKIEHAFFNHLSAELISTLTAEGTESMLQYDISQVNWDRYMMVVMFVDTASDGGFEFNAGSGHETCQNLFNTTVYMRNYFLEAYDVNRIVLLFPVLYNGDHSTTAFGLGADTAAGHPCVMDSACVKYLNQLSTISMQRITLGSTFLPGDKIELWGIK